MLCRLAFASMVIVTVRLLASAASDQQRSAAAAKAQLYAFARAFPNILPPAYSPQVQDCVDLCDKAMASKQSPSTFRYRRERTSQDQAAGGGSAGGSRCLVWETADITPIPIITSAPTMIQVCGTCTR